MDIDTVCTKQECKNKIANLEQIMNALTIRVTKLSRFVCRYCRRCYVSAAGLTRHLGHHCQNKHMADQEAENEYERLAEFLPLVVRSQPQDYSIALDTTAPADIRVTITTAQRATTYKLANDKDRWWLMCFLERHEVLPMDLMSPDSYATYESRQPEFCAAHGRTKCYYCIYDAFGAEMRARLTPRDPVWHIKIELACTNI